MLSAPISIIVGRVSAASGRLSTSADSSATTKSPIWAGRSATGYSAARSRIRCICVSTFSSDNSYLDFSTVSPVYGPNSTSGRSGTIALKINGFSANSNCKSSSFGWANGSTASCSSASA